jgi:C-terminal processing protease CtpA/Prc
MDGVPGERFERPVYLLTSAGTVSAPEEFAYDLRVLNRATIVGEKTLGGANPGGLSPLGDGFAVFIPGGRAINPVTGTNWEGEGIAPDVAVPAAEALATAHRLALTALLPTVTDPDFRREVEQALWAPGTRSIP